MIMAYGTPRTFLLPFFRISSRSVILVADTNSELSSAKGVVKLKRFSDIPLT